MSAPVPEPDPEPRLALDPASAACLERTRSAVLNVLVVVGIGIAASGLLLRWRDGWAVQRGPESHRRTLLGCLVFLVVLSYAMRRWLAGRAALRDPKTRLTRFYIGHLKAALVAAAVLPLGLIDGWFIDPRLGAVAPYWIAALALGFLALPRASELEDFDEPVTEAGVEPGGGASPP